MSEHLTDGSGERAHGMHAGRGALTKERPDHQGDSASRSSTSHGPAWKTTEKNGNIKPTLKSCIFQMYSKEPYLSGVLMVLPET